MVEMIETADILNNVNSRSLVILDEVGRGTSTYDGMSIAWAVLEYLQGQPDRRPKVLFATHFHELTALSERLPGVKNLSMAVEESGDGIVFLYKVIPAPADRSYGIEVEDSLDTGESAVHGDTPELEKRAQGSPVPPAPLRGAVGPTRAPATDSGTGEMEPTDDANQALKYLTPE